jgi:hypothetical protein
MAAEMRDSAYYGYLAPIMTFGEGPKASILILTGHLEKVTPLQVGEGFN